MIIGLTGNIGTGKSTIMSILSELGYIVLDSDKIAHDMILKDNLGYKLVVNAFGKGILSDHSDKEIDRKKLADCIFSDVKMKERLEEIMHPLILNKLKSESARFPNQIIIWELPLLFEAKLEHYMDQIICVDSNEDLIIQRVMKRSNLSAEEVRMRLNNQLPASYKKDKANYIIINNTDLNSLRIQVEMIMKEIEDK